KSKAFGFWARFLGARWLISGRRTCPAEALAKEEAAHPPNLGERRYVLGRSKRRRTREDNTTTGPEGKSGANHCADTERSAPAYFSN
ncbi:MAG TPA: hypothetical protein VN952_12635, partial [Chthoniobacterales bacterium]|nr:hypothetical protein [Chthoniobacterales bacterium]